MLILYCDEHDVYELIKEWGRFRRTLYMQSNILLNKWEKAIKFQLSHQILVG